LPKPNHGIKWAYIFVVAPEYRSWDVGTLLTFKFAEMLPLGCPVNEAAALVFLLVSVLRVVVGVITVWVNPDCRNRDKTHADNDKDRTLPSKKGGTNPGGISAARSEGSCS
jgi:hypothetical protein